MEAINAAPVFNTTFPANSWLGDNLRMVARTIAAHQLLGVRRQTFFVSVGGWDHHDEVLDNQEVMLAEVSAGLGAFHAALVELGMDNAGTLFTASDFGLSPPTARVPITRGAGTTS